MKAQMSLEFTVYAAISLAALVGALAAYADVGPKYSSMAGNAELGAFVSTVNANMRYSASTFEAFVPKSACRYANVSALGGFEFDSRVIIGTGVCAGSGSVESLGMSMLGNGTFVLMVKK